MEVATQNPGILPGMFDLNEMRKDVELTNALQPIIMALSQLQGMMDDTMRVATSEAYTAALNVYSYAKASGSAAARGARLRSWDACLSAAMPPLHPRLPNDEMSEGI